MTTICVDPGKDGGIAWEDDGTVKAVPMPDGMSAQANFIIGLKMAADDRVKCYLEKTGTYRSGNSGPASATFARHCGNLEGILYVLGIPTEQVSAGVWQKKLGALPKEKPERKRMIKEMMAREYPHLAITLKTADAVAILYAMTRRGGEYDNR